MAAQRYRIVPGKIEYSTIDNEVIIIHYDTGNYYTLSNSGALIWQMIERQSTLDELVSSISAAYEVTLSTDIAQDVRTFVGELAAESLVEVISDSQTPATVPLETAGVTRLPYESPLLERYSDMQALLILDPIHEVDVKGWPHASQGGE